MNRSKRIIELVGEPISSSGIDKDLWYMLKNKKTGMYYVEGSLIILHNTHDTSDEEEAAKVKGSDLLAHKDIKTLLTIWDVVPSEEGGVEPSMRRAKLDPRYR